MFLLKIRIYASQCPFCATSTIDDVSTLKKKSPSIPKPKEKCIEMKPLKLLNSPLIYPMSGIIWSSRDSATINMWSGRGFFFWENNKAEKYKSSCLQNASSLH